MAGHRLTVRQVLPLPIEYLSECIREPGRGDPRTNDGAIGRRGGGARGEKRASKTGALPCRPKKLSPRSGTARVSNDTLRTVMALAVISIKSDDDDDSRGCSMNSNNNNNNNNNDSDNG
jgi:hypothetical protein